MRCARAEILECVIRAIVTQSEKGQPWASVRDVETRQPGGASIAARRVGWQHGGNGATNPHRGGRVRSVGRLLTVCEQMRSIVGRPGALARGQPGRGGGHGPGGARVVFGACGTVGAVVSLRY